MSRLNKSLLKKWWANGARAGRYVVVSFVTGLGQLAAVPIMPLARPILGWQLHRSADYVNADEPSRRPRRDDQGRWLASHGALGVGFGALLAAYVAVLGAVLYAWGAAFSRLFYLGNPNLEQRIFNGTIGTILLTGVVGGLAAGLVVQVLPRLAEGHAKLSISLLSSSAAERRAAELAERVDVLTSTRSDALDAHGAELRRIERDLHDGTQAQLVALSMRLGLAEESVRDRPETATLLREARTGAEEAMAELRDVVRTMYPPILADRGLAGAISGLAGRSLIPTKVTTDDLGPLPAPVEAAAYFVVAEALTNAAKHSAATQILVHLDRDSTGLHVQVTDDGLGGADETQGTGILGIQRRVAALDGTTTIHSPIGAGTTMTVEIPCRA